MTQLCNDMNIKTSYKKVKRNIGNLRRVLEKKYYEGKFEIKNKTYLT